MFYVQIRRLAGTQREIYTVMWTAYIFSVRHLKRGLLFLERTGKVEMLYSLGGRLLCMSCLFSCPECVINLWRGSKNDVCMSVNRDDRCSGWCAGRSSEARQCHCHHRSGPVQYRLHGNAGLPHFAQPAFRGLACAAYVRVREKGGMRAEVADWPIFRLFVWIGMKGEVMGFLMMPQGTCALLPPLIRLPLT